MEFTLEVLQKLEVIRSKGRKIGYTTCVDYVYINGSFYNFIFNNNSKKLTFIIKGIDLAPFFKTYSLIKDEEITYTQVEELNQHDVLNIIDECYKQFKLNLLAQETVDDIM